MASTKLIPQQPNSSLNLIISHLLILKNKYSPYILILIDKGRDADDRRLL
jgi:hypothetical protein